MGRLNFTRLGALKLGQTIRVALEEQEPPWKQHTLIERLAQIGHDINTPGVSRLINGQTEKVDAALLLAIADLGIVRNPATGDPFSLRELILIGCEAIDPSTITKGDTAPGPPAYPAAVAEIKRGMGDRSLDQFAKTTGISKKRLTAILTSPDPGPGQALPTWEELLKITSAIYANKSIEPLARLYGYGSKVDQPSMR